MNNVLKTDRKMYYLYSLTLCLKHEIVVTGICEAV